MHFLEISMLASILLCCFLLTLWWSLTARALAADTDILLCSIASLAPVAIATLATRGLSSRLAMPQVLLGSGAHGALTLLSYTIVSRFPMMHPVQAFEPLIVVVANLPTKEPLAQLLILAVGSLGIALFYGGFQPTTGALCVFLSSVASAFRSVILSPFPKGDSGSVALFFDASLVAFGIAVPWWLLLQSLNFFVRTGNLPVLSMHLLQRLILCGLLHFGAACCSFEILQRIPAMSHIFVMSMMRVSMVPLTLLLDGRQSWYDVSPIGLALCILACITYGVFRSEKIFPRADRPLVLVFWKPLLVTTVILILVSYSALQGRTAPIPPTSGSPAHAHSLNVRVLVIQTYAYGNNGDEMETTPVLEKLKSWSVSRLDVALVRQAPAPGASATRMLSLADEIFQGFDAVNLSRYDVVIQAPGPTLSIGEIERVCRYGLPVIVVGITMVMSTHALKVVNSSCVRLIILREKVSFSHAVEAIGHSSARSKLVFSGDLSFSFNASMVLFNAWREICCNGLHRMPQAYTLFFKRAGSASSFRAHNSKDALHVDLVTLKDSNSTTNLSLSFPDFGRSIVVATSDPPADAGSHFTALREAIPRATFISCTSPEHLWALVECAQSIYTDRYHPAVAALIRGKSFLPIYYERERQKMAGIWELRTTKPEDLYAANRKTWELLYHELFDLQRT